MPYLKILPAIQLNYCAKAKPDIIPIQFLGNEAFLTNWFTISIKNNDIDVHFIDFENIWENDFTVTNQYWVQGYKW